MSDLAPLLQAFFTDKLNRQRQASPHTVAAYRDAFTLLLGFVCQRTGRQPSQLGVADLDAVTIGAFLQHLKPSGVTRPRRVMLAWPRSTPSSATPRCATPSTPRSSSGCWQSHPSAWIGRSSAI